MQEHLIIFTRYPEPGKAKTRLIPALGEVGAAQLHRQMTESTIAQSRKLRSIRPVSICVYYTGGTLVQMQDWLGHDLEYRSQCSGELGERLIDVFQFSFGSGAGSVVAIGTDCPNLTAELLTTAFLKLNEHCLSIGRATDGGYYLIGLNQFVPDIFRDITWSTDLVFQQTVEIAERLDLSIAVLPTLNDIDRPEDLRHLP